MEPVPDWLKNPGIRDFPIDAQRSLDILDFPLGDVPDTSTPPMIPDRLTSPNIWDMPYDDARSIDDLVMMAGNMSKLTGNKKIYYETTGNIASGEVHHALPQQFADYFDEVGLNVNSDLPKNVHRLKPKGLHTKTNDFGKTWNKAWQEFFTKNPTFTKKDVLKQLDNMIQETGIGKYK